MKVKLFDGLLFKGLDGRDGNAFELKLYDFYDDGEPIWCAFGDDGYIYPLDEIIIENYMPFVNGQWINEPCEYE